jgi:hypothetical protein
MCCSKAFKKAIVRTFSAKGGVLWESMSDKQLCQYLMSLTETFYSTNGCVKKAALILGKQPDSDVYVFGDKMQVRNINIRKFM